MNTANAFAPFSAMHATVVALFALAAALLILVGRRLDPESRGRMERALGWFALGLWLVSNGWWILPPRFDVSRSLPLHLCDLTSLLAGLVLLWPRRSLRALLYFWGFSMSLQAIVTPEIAFGPESMWFWIFWLSHSAIIGIASYDIVVRGFRPTWSDYRTAVVAGVAYLVVVFTIDALTGFNYGFVGNARPGQASVVDFLGPWPRRVLFMAALAIGAMTLLMLPWHCRRRPLTAEKMSRDVKENRSREGE